MTENPVEIAFNPLVNLRADTEVRSVYARILCQRFETEILSGYYHLAGAPDQFDPLAHTETLIKYLIDVADQGPDLVAAEFKTRFKYEGSAFWGRPPSLRVILSSYFLVKEARTDLVMVSDLVTGTLPSRAVVADIGCGRNKLGRALLTYADRNNVDCSAVIGTDVAKYDDNTPDSDPRLTQQNCRVL